MKPKEDTKESRAGRRLGRKAGVAMAGLSFFLAAAIFSPALAKAAEMFRVPTFKSVTPQRTVVVEDTRNPGPAPTNVSATSTGPTSVEVRWNHAPGANHYSVWRFGPSPNDQKVVSGNNKGAMFTDQGVRPNALYHYEVIAHYFDHSQASRPGVVKGAGKSQRVSVRAERALQPTNLIAKANFTHGKQRFPCVSQQHSKSKEHILCGPGGW